MSDPIILLLTISYISEYIQPTLLHDLSRAASLELLMLSVIFKQEELYRAIIKEFIWRTRRNYSDPVYTNPEFKDKYPHLATALGMQASEVWKDTYTCRIVDWEKVHKDDLQARRQVLEAKSSELDKMFAL